MNHKHTWYVTRVAALGLFTLYLTGCARTVYVPTGFTERRLPSFVDPDFTTHTFSRIVVFADTTDLGFRQTIESMCVDAVKDPMSLPAASLFAPTRTWAMGDMIEMMKRKGIDAYVQIKTRDVGVGNRYVEPKSTATTTTTTKRVPADKGDGKEETEVQTTKTSVQQTGGYTMRWTWASYDIKLIDVATGRTAWVSSGSIDDAFSAQQLCSDIIYQLRADSLLRR